MKRVLPALLVVLGLAQMIADLCRLDAVKGIAAATGASPAPKVFSAVKGFETFSTKFFISFEERVGEDKVDAHERFELTPERCSRLRGPYDRRNVYGAAIAYAPVLPAGLRDPVLEYALCGAAPLLRELDIRTGQPNARPWLVLQPLPGASFEGSTRFSPDCR
jgi:hypothetical protein